MVPELAVFFRPARDLLEAIGFEHVDALASLFSFAHEPRFAENAQVSRDRRPAHPETGRELGHVRVAATQAIEDRSSRRIGYREENVGGCCWSWHCERK